MKEPRNSRFLQAKFTMSGRYLKAERQQTVLFLLPQINNSNNDTAAFKIWSSEGPGILLTNWPWSHFKSNSKFDCSLTLTLSQLLP